MKYIQLVDQKSAKESILQRQLLNIDPSIGEYLVKNIRKWNRRHPTDRVDKDILLTVLTDDSDIMKILLGSENIIISNIHTYLNFKDQIANTIMSAGTKEYYELLKVLVLDEDTNQSKKNTAISYVMNQGDLKMVLFLLSR